MHPSVADLADRQLAAYNNADLDAFCACYAADVAMLEDEEVVLRGRAAFRERYEDMFARGGFGATVPKRLVLGDHCVDEEHWWRVDPETGVRSEGVVLVRYRAVQGEIAVVQFLGE